MKRTIALLLAVIMVLSTAVQAFALEESAMFTAAADKTTLENGMTSTISVSLDKAETGVASLEYHVYFDENVLELDSGKTAVGSVNGDIEISEKFGTGTDAYYKVLFVDTKATGTESFAAGKLCDIAFKVKADAAKGDTDVRFKIESYYKDYGNTKIDADTTKSITLTVSDHKYISTKTDAGKISFVCDGCGDSYEMSGLPFTVTASGTDIVSTALAPAENGYKDIDWTGAEQTVPLYTVTVPLGLETVGFSFDDDVLVYNYSGNYGRENKTAVPTSCGNYTGHEYGDYIAGAVEDPTLGKKAYTVSVDADTDGNADYIYVQSPYDDDGEWGKSFLLYAVTFSFHCDHDGMVRHEAAAATCSADGNSEYYECGACGKYFSDAAGTSEIEKDSWVIASTGAHTDADSDFFCDDCGTYFGALATATQLVKIVAPAGSKAEFHVGSDGTGAIVKSTLVSENNGILEYEITVPDGSYSCMVSDDGHNYGGVGFDMPLMTSIYEDTNLTLVMVRFYTTNAAITKTDDFTLNLVAPGKAVLIPGDNYLDSTIKSGSTYVVAPRMVWAYGNQILYNYTVELNGDLAKTNGVSPVINATFASTLKAVQNKTFSVAALKEFRLIAPTDAETVFYYQINNFNDMVLEGAERVKSVDNGDGTTTYSVYYPAFTNASYRVTKDGYVTAAGYACNITNNKGYRTYENVGGKATAVYSDAVRVELRKGDPASTDTAIISKAGAGSNIEYENSVYLNIDDSKDTNELALGVGETFRLRAFRAPWEIVNTVTANIMIEPDFHYEVLSGSDVISVTPVTTQCTGNAKGNWMDIKALKAGNALIAVWYDAIDIGGDTQLAGTYGAADPARYGYVYVTVGSDSTVKFNPVSHDGDWDAEFDTVYYYGDSGNFTIAPEGATSVTVRNINGKTLGAEQNVSAEDGKYNVPVSNGSNLVSVTTSAGTDYMLVRAKKIKYTIENKTTQKTSDDADFSVKVGDEICVHFDQFSMPVAKMSGIYNPGYGQTAKTMFTLNGSYALSSSGAQYDYITDAKSSITFTVMAEGENTLSGGFIQSGSMGDNFGNHRNITDAGRGTNFSAVNVTGHFGTIEDIKFTALPNSENPVSGDDLTKVNKVAIYSGSSAYNSFFSFSQTSASSVKDNNAANWKSTSISDYYLSATVTTESYYNTIKLKYWYDGEEAKTLDLSSGIEKQITDFTAKKDKVLNMEITVTPADPKYGGPKTYSYVVYPGAASLKYEHPIIKELTLGNGLGETFGVSSALGDGIRYTVLDYTAKVNVTADDQTVTLSGKELTQYANSTNKTQDQSDAIVLQLYNGSAPVGDAVTVLEAGGYPGQAWSGEVDLAGADSMKLTLTSYVAGSTASRTYTISLVKHVHDESGEWEKNGTGHWKLCSDTDAHADPVKVKEAAHDFGDPVVKYEKGSDDKIVKTTSRTCGTCGYVDSTEVKSDEKTVKVSYTAQAANGFLVAPQDEAEVTSYIAESCGFADSVDYTANVSVLDVLVKAHIDIFGDDFKSDPKSYLELSSAGYVTKVFGTSTGNFGFTVNDLCPVHGEKDGSGYYTGYTVPETVVNGKDSVLFAAYQDDWGMDDYVFFSDGSGIKKEFTVQKNHSLGITVEGYTVGWYGCMCKDLDEVYGMCDALSGLHIAVVNTTTGALTDIAGAVTDNNGEATLKFAETGDYVITAYMTDADIANYENPAVMTLAKVTVTDCTDHKYISSLQSDGSVKYACEYCGDSYSMNALPITVTVGGKKFDSASMTPVKDGYAFNNYGVLETVPLYTIAIPENAEDADIEFNDAALAYNYTGAYGERNNTSVPTSADLYDPKEYESSYGYYSDWADGIYSDVYTGEKTASVKVDANGDGKADYIHVQSPYDADGDYGKSVLICAVTFKYSHDLVFTTATDATCEADGNDAYYTCTICGKYFSDPEGTAEIEKDSWILTATGHEFDDGKVTTEPTCTKNGVLTYTCKNDPAHTKTEAVPMTAHKFENGVCTVCGEKDVNYIIATATDTEVLVTKTDVDPSDPDAIKAFSVEIQQAVGDMAELAGRMVAALQKATGEVAPEGSLLFDVNASMEIIENGVVTDVIKLTDNNFPSEGIKVTFTAAELGLAPGTLGSYRFTMSHMFSTTYGGHNAGDIEICAGTVSGDTVTFTIHGCSPMMISWSLIPTLTLSSGGSGDESRIYVGGKGSNLPAQEEENPNTGAPVFISAPAAAIAVAAAGLVAVRRRKH